MKGILAFLVVALLVVVSVSAELDSLGITVNDVKVDGDSITADQIIKTNLERDVQLEVKVQVQTDGSTTVEDVEVIAMITGAKDDIEDSTKPFNVVANTVYTKTLKLSIPERTTDREYQLRVIVTSPNSDTLSYVYPLLISPIDQSIVIKEASFSPSNKVIAGRAMTAVARLKNYGQEDSEDVKVVFSIPELGVQEVDYIDEIEKDETVSTEEVLLRIPATAKTGEYTVKVEVFYDDYDEKTTATYQINVEGDDQAAQTVSGASGKTIITIGMQSQSVAKGENGVVYPISITNGATASKTFTLTLSGVQDWAVTKVSPSNVVILNSGETKQVYVYVAANENSAVGEHVFSVDVKAGNDVVQQIPLKADVMGSNASSSAWKTLKNVLATGVILLVILLIVLGVVILYQRKFKTESKEDEQIAQTYY